MNLSEFHLLRPEWLFALVPLALGLWWLARDNAGTPAWRGLVDTHLLPHLLVGEPGRATRTPLWLLGIGGLLAIVALAGPVWRRLPQPVYTTRAERVIVVDISDSMNVADVAPSRLARARFEVMDLLRRFKEGQTALIAYGAEPYIVSPLTGDARTIAAQVPALSSDLLPVSGARRTDLALAEAGRLLAQAGSAGGSVILVTDGLDHPGATLEAVRALRTQGDRVSVLGIGTAQGAPVPLAGGGFLKNADGKVAMAALDTGALESVATAGGGRYVTATADDSDVDALARAVQGEPQKAVTQDTRDTDQWREEGPWLLLALLPLGALAFRRGWLSPLLLVVLLAPPPQAQASWWSSLWSRPDQTAASLLQSGDAREAARQFQRPDWRAASDYAAGQYADALKDLTTSDDANAWYNRGNTLAQLGSLQDAVSAYDRALGAEPDNADARYNRDLVKRLLEQQQKQQQSQQTPSGAKQQSGDQKTGEGGKGSDAAKSSPEQGVQSSGRNDAQSQSGTESESGDPAQSKAQQAQTASNQAQQSDAQSKQGAGADKTPDAAGKESSPDQNQRAPSAQSQSASAQETRADRQAGKGDARSKPVEQAGQGANAAGDAQRNTAPRSTQAPGTRPGLADLLGDSAQNPSDGVAAQRPLTEAQQAVENQLNQVPDDPAGLLRQRFLLQHLRRTGQL